EDVYDEFSKKLSKDVKAFVDGDGLKKTSQVGPLINEEGLKKVEEHVQDAIDNGAKIETGGKAMKGLFFEPTVLSNMPAHSISATEETFGPICALFKFKTEEEVIKLANDTPFGL